MIEPVYLCIFIAGFIGFIFGFSWLQGSEIGWNTHISTELISVITKQSEEIIKLRSEIAAMRSEVACMRIDIIDQKGWQPK